MSAMAAYDLCRHDERQEAALVANHGGLVKRIAQHLLARLPDNIQSDDLLQAGMIGLLEAARNFDDDQGASFETYAGIRIRGAMLDEVRRHDWTPRSVHRKSREAAQAIRAVENREGRAARDVEVAEELGIDLADYHRLLADCRGQRLLSLEDADGEESSLVECLPSDTPGLFDQLQTSDLQQSLATVIDELPERERLVMALYYDEELNLREIGAVMGVTESRICQIHGQALTRVRARMTDWTVRGT